MCINVLLLLLLFAMCSLQHSFFVRWCTVDVILIIQIEPKEKNTSAVYLDVSQWEVSSKLMENCSRFDDVLSIRCVRTHIILWSTSKGNGWLISPLNCGAMQSKPVSVGQHIGLYLKMAMFKNSKITLRMLSKLLVI